MNSFHPQAVAKVNSGISASGTEVSVSMAGEADARLPHFADLIPGFQSEANEIIRIMLNFIDEKARIPRDGIIGFWVGAIR